jgi:hypothetical protein
MSDPENGPGALKVNPKFRKVQVQKIMRQYFQNS